MNKNVLIVLALVLGLVLLGGAIFAVSKLETQVQAPVVTPEISKQPAIPKDLFKLEITIPTDKLVVKIPNVLVQGTTTPNAEVTFNEVSVKADATGKFMGYVPLFEGENPIIVTAVDTDGSMVEKEISVIYEP